MYYSGMSQTSEFEFYLLKLLIFSLSPFITYLVFLIIWKVYNNQTAEKI